MNEVHTSHRFQRTGNEDFEEIEVPIHIGSCIEVVITGRTRNALALRGTRVRIPPTPIIKTSGLSQVFLLFVKEIAFYLYFDALNIVSIVAKL